MSYSFTIRGHPNVRATHKTTLEFTRDSDLTPAGDCIIGVGASFDSGQLEGFRRCSRLIVTISCEGISDRLEASANNDFSDEHEAVIRLGTHSGARTLATGASKAAKHLDRALIAKLRDPKKTATVTLNCELWRP